MTLFCKTILNQLQVTKNKLLKVLFNKNYRYHTDELYQEHKKLKAEDICNIAIMKFVHRLRSSECPISFKNYKTREATHGRNTRNKTDLAKNTIKINYGKRAVHYRGAKLWNHLTINVRNSSSKDFRNIVFNKFMGAYNN